MPGALLRPIDWSIIADAASFYASEGYEPVEVPWMVPHSVTWATAPPQAAPHTLANSPHDLVGSGEQGLLRLASCGLLRPGRYVTTTPCFRGDMPDILHGTHFIKVELMDLRPDVGVEHRDALIDHATTFFSRHLPVRKIQLEEPYQVDIISAVHGVELGSYGLRTALGVRWAYGTGVAEPRLSTVMGFPSV